MIYVCQKRRVKETFLIFLVVCAGGGGVSELCGAAAFSGSPALWSLSFATHCNALQQTAIHCNAHAAAAFSSGPALSALFCNTLQRTAAHCNTLQRPATYCNAHLVLRPSPAVQRSGLAVWRHAATHLKILQHNATYYNMLQPTAVALSGSSAL